MGCNQSKQEDVRASDEQQRQRTSPQPAATQSTPSRAIASSVPDQVGQNLGKSFSDQRDDEQGYFKDIVERTAHNFIDVTVTGAQDKEVQKAHSKDFSASLFDPKEFSNKAFGLPNPSASLQYQPIRNTLSQPTPKQLLDLTTNTNQAIIAGLKAMHVADVGEIVINFPEI